MRWILRSMPNKNSGEKIKKKRTNNKKKGGGAGASSSRRRKRKAVEWKWRRRTQKKIESIRTDGKIKTKQKSTSAPITGRHGKRGVGNRFFFYSFFFFFLLAKKVCVLWQKIFFDFSILFRVVRNASPKGPRAVVVVVVARRGSGRKKNRRKKKRSEKEGKKKRNAGVDWNVASFLLGAIAVGVITSTDCSPLSFFSSLSLSLSLSHPDKKLSFFSLVLKVILLS